MMRIMNIGAFLLFSCNHCRQVTINKDYAKLIPRDRLLSNEEWRHMGIQMSLGWEHYCLYRY